MRRFLPFAAALGLAGCATAPQPQPQVRPTTVARPAPQVRNDLMGMTAGELVQRFGQPALQVREGAGLKLQFRGSCVLDAYLYPATSGQGLERVTYVDTRLRSGMPTDQAGCISALSAP